MFSILNFSPQGSMVYSSHRSTDFDPQLEISDHDIESSKIPNPQGVDITIDHGGNSPIISIEVIQMILDYFPRQDLVVAAKTSHAMQRLVEMMISADVREITPFIKKDPEFKDWTITKCSDLANLTSLSINSAGITEVPRSIYLLKNLQIIELIDNKISYLPQEMRNLKHLSHINLDRNLFESYPLVLTEIDSLREVHISGNPVPRKLPEAYKCFSKVIHNTR